MTKCADHYVIIIVTRHSPSSQGTVCCVCKEEFIVKTRERECFPLGVKVVVFKE